MVSLTLTHSPWGTNLCTRRSSWEVELALLGIVLQLRASQNRVARHDLPAKFDQAQHVGVVQAEHGGFGVLEADGALELISDEAPEAGAVVLSGDNFEAQIPLQLDHRSDGLLKRDTFSRMVSRASSSRWGRRRKPTSSARNVGIVEAITK
ncbi:hypothetical protein VTI74DRAFT_4407 [Chaetomium olivicolor]